MVAGDRNDVFATAVEDFLVDLRCGTRRIRFEEIKRNDLSGHCDDFLRRMLIIIVAAKVIPRGRIRRTMPCQFPENSGCRFSKKARHPSR